MVTSLSKSFISIFPGEEEISQIYTVLYEELYILITQKIEREFIEKLKIKVLIIYLTIHLIILKIYTYPFQQKLIE